MTRARPAGDAGLLIETDEPPATLASAITQAGLPAVLDVVPGARTVLVITVPGSWDPGELATVIGQLPAGNLGAGDAAEVEIPAVYDGPDLAEVARLSGLSVSEVVEAHSRAVYTVGWLGFAPGFGYLTGLDPRLAGVPRLPSPRVRVPAGSIAIAGGMSAVYPASSPGGWRLIGRTTTRMWDPGREPPALLAPGRRVRFIAQQGPSAGSAPGQAKRLAPPTASLRLPLSRISRSSGRVRWRPFRTLADTATEQSACLPRVLRMPRAWPRPTCWRAIRPARPGIELTLGRAEFRAGGGCTLAVAGAPADITLRTGQGGQASQRPFGAAFAVPDGGVVSIGPPTAGLRSYLAVSGGITTPAELGSRSADLHSGVGGPLRAGAILPVGGPAPAPGDRQGSLSPAAGAGVGPLPGAGRRLQRSGRFPARGAITRLRIVPGPRTDWFAPRALPALLGSVYKVAAASNRTGLRLDGQALTRSGEAELPSEGVVTGALQVPHDGQPILLLSDHPTVGGYPMIAVLATADIGLAAQLRPGDKIAFTVTSVAEAVASAADSAVGGLHVAS